MKEHGMGNQNKIEHAAEYSPGPGSLEEFAGKYLNTLSTWDTINIEYYSGINKFGNLLMEPIGESQFFADGTDAPVTFFTR